MVTISRPRYLALALLAMAPWSVAGAQGEAPQGSDFPLKSAVNRAIARGVDHLKQHQRPDGGWPGHEGEHPGGMTSLAAFTLVKSGVRRGDESVRRALASLEGVEIRSTYSTAVNLLLLESLREPARWRGLAAERLAFLVETQEAGLWRYPWGETDMSNVQFALLGLRAAHHMGLEIPRDALTDAAAALWNLQVGSSGFAYNPGRAATGGITAATLAGVAVVEELSGGNPGAQRILRKHRRERAAAEAWMDAKWAPDRNAYGPRSWTPGFYYPYMWAVERYCAFTGREELGGRDWYREGARHLVETQRADGGWGGGREDTCFALLFLRRASLSGEREELEELERELESAIEPPPPVPRPDPEVPWLADWLLAGPWSSSMEEPLVASPPFRPDRAKPRDRGRIAKRKWERASLSRTGWTDLDALSSRGGDHQLWALASVLRWEPGPEEPALLEARLWLSFEDGWSVWLDGERISCELRAGAPIVEDVILDVELSAGDHVLLALVEDLYGASAFSARISDRDGAPLPPSLVALADPRDRPPAKRPARRPTREAEGGGDGQVRVISKSTRLRRGALLRTPLVIAADGIRIDGNGATIQGPGAPGDKATLAGIGVLLEGRRGVTIRDLKVHGFEIGLSATDCEDLNVEGCDLSDNWHDPEHGWGDGERQGGIILTRVHRSSFRDNRANRVWNGIDLWESDDNLVEKNDFSHCSNVCLKLWRSSRNRVLDNDLSFGLRMKPGEVHARDSTCVLIETGSDDNRFERNDITHGGDGVFIRPLNGWVSAGNVFVENDCSYANNNGFESWSPGNVFLRNTANHCSFGFWLGGSDATVLIGNEAAFNGLPDGKHNAPESDFGHGGIVIVHGSGSHGLIQDNWCHDNAGGGIVFRGDLASRGERWKMRHLVVQGNRLERNRWGIFGRFADGLYLAGNRFEGNQEDEHLEEVTGILRGEGPLEHREGDAPQVSFEGPERVFIGEPVRFDASACGPELRYSWDVGGTAYDTPRVEHVFEEPGFHRVSLTADDGRRAGLAFRDVYAISRAPEPATEGGASSWGGSATDGSELHLADSGESLVGESCVHLRPDPYGGGEVSIVLPGTRDAGWDLGEKRELVFWLRFRNPNRGFQGPTILRLFAGEGVFTYVPVRDGRPINLLSDLPYPEARYGWLRVEVPLRGGPGWIRSEGLGGNAPPRYEGDLEILTLETPVRTAGTSSLASGGGHLYCAVLEGDRFWRTADGVAWEELRGPRADLGSRGDWINGMLAWHAGGLILRHLDPERDEHGVEWSRLVRYDPAADRWYWLPTRLAAGHGSAVIGGRLHAIMDNYGGPIGRVDLSDPGPRAERTALAGIEGSNPGWLSRAAQLCALDGRIYGIKNDWTTPRPLGGECGDRLFAFDPAAFDASDFAGGEPWKDSSWSAGWTPVEDLGPLPFEVGHGAALVALPPSWCGAIGERGGLFLVAGCSPSDHEGRGAPSDRFALYDLESARFTLGSLPDVTGHGTSAAFHDGKVFVKRGGLSFAAFDEDLWSVEPIPAERAERARGQLEERRMSLERVDCLSLRFDSNGHRPFDLWIDGLRFE